MFDVTLTFKTNEPPVHVIMNFHGDNFFLSNFYPVSIRFEKRVYRATEPAYFAWMSADEAIKDHLQVMSPAEAKAFTQTHEFKKQRIFKTQDELLAGMEVFVRQKFFENAELGDWLLATGDALLIEGNTWGDTNFGVCMKTGEGRNGLGKMLMKIRTELREWRKERGL